MFRLYARNARGMFFVPQWCAVRDDRSVRDARSGYRQFLISLERIGPAAE